MIKRFKSIPQLIMALSLTLCYTSCDDDNDEPKMGNWVRVDDTFSGAPRGSAVCFKIGNVAYVGTGVNTNEKENIERFRDFFSATYDDNGNLVWSSNWEKNGEGVTSMPESYYDEKIGKRVNATNERNGAVAFELNGKGYVGLGYNRSGYFKDFWEFDPNGTPNADDYPSLSDEVKAKVGSSSTGSWRRVADYPGDSCRYAVAFVLTTKDGKTKAYVGTGEDYEGKYKNDFYAFDGEKWEAVPSTGIERAQASAFTYRASDGVEYGYVVGGINSGGMTHLFSRYNPETNCWETLHNISNSSRESYDDGYNAIGRVGGVAFVLPADDKHDAKAYYAIGSSAGSMSTDCWEYDLESDIWTRKHDFEGSSRMFAVSFVLELPDAQNGVKHYAPYMLTGHNTNLSSDDKTTCFSDVWTFHPNEKCNLFD